MKLMLARIAKNLIIIRSIKCKFLFQNGDVDTVCNFLGKPMKYSFESETFNLEQF